MLALFLFLAAPQSCPQPDPLPYGGLLPTSLDPVAHAGVDEFAAGRFLGDGRPCLATLAEGEVVLTYSPDAFRASKILAGCQDDVSAIATLPGLGQDLLLTAGENGLEANWAGSNSGGGHLVRLLARGDWIGAKHLLVADFSGNGLLDVAGVNALENQVITLLQLPGGSLVPGPSFDLTRQRVLDLHVVDFHSSSATPEIFVVHQSSLELLSLSPLFQLSLPVHGRVIDSDTARLGASTEDGIVLLLRGSKLTDPAQVVSVLPNRISVRNLGNIGATSFATADINGDQLDDIWVQGGAGTRISHFLQRPPGPSSWAPFRAVDRFDYDFEELPTGFAAEPAPIFAFDLDMDGDKDLWFHRPGVGLALFMRGTLIDELEKKPCVEQFTLFNGGVFGGSSWMLAMVSTRMPTEVPDWATHLELSVWRGDESFTEVDPIFVTQSPISQLNGGDLNTLPVPLPESSVNFLTHYGIVMRFTRCGPNAMTTRSSSNAVFLIDGEEFQPNPTALVSGWVGQGQGPRPPMPRMADLPPANPPATTSGGNCP